MDQQIGFCATVDGVRIAYAVMGQGPALVDPPKWVGHLERDLDDPAWRAFWESLARHHTLIRFDRHGCGLSDRQRTDFSLESDVRSLAAVVDHLQLRRFTLLGVSDGGPIAIAYAAQHQQRVSQLILYGTFAHLDPAAAELNAALASLVRAHWGIGSRTLADMFTPGADAPALEAFAAFQRAAATAEMAAQLLLWDNYIDLRTLLPSLRIPTVVMHRESDLICAFECGRELAALIPGARFVPLPGELHPPAHGDSNAVLRVIAEFLGDPEPERLGEAGLSMQLTASPAADMPAPAPRAAANPAGLTPRELEVLRLLATGKSNPQIAAALIISLNTVERHVNHILAKTGAANRVEASRFAHRHGLVE